jgi:hypothetical protein
MCPLFCRCQAPIPQLQHIEVVEPPGPAYEAYAWAFEAMLTIEDHLSVTSEETRQELAVFRPQVQTESAPQLHIA